MREDSLIVPDPDDVTNPAARMLVLTAMAGLLFSIGWAALMENRNWEFRDPAFLTVFSVIAVGSLCVLVGATVIFTFNGMAERRLCYWSWFWLFVIFIFASLSVPAVTATTGPYLGP